MADQISAGVWVVVPAYNEDRALNEVVGPLVSAGYSVVVVDDGSTRAVQGVLTCPGIFVCRHPINLGQGAALRTGIEFAIQRGARFIVTFDADGQHQAAEVPRLLQPLLDGECEVVLGSRFMHSASVENIPFGKYLVLKLAVLFTRFTTGLKLTDTHNGFRAMTASAANRIEITQNRMAHASQILNSVSQLKLSFKEVPVTIRYTEYSMRKGQRLSNAINILWESFAEKI